MMNKCYDNRELSWLKFNERVMEEARDGNVPLCERLLFAQIYQSNLDEFFMIRVGSLYDQTLVHSNVKENKTGMTAGEQLEEIYKRVAGLIPVRDETYKGIMKQLQEYGIEQVDLKKLSKEEEAYLSAYFNSEIRPLISPQVVDKRHPFPFLTNKGTYIAAHLEAKNSVKMGIIPASGSFSRLIFLPCQSKIRFLLAEDLILHYASSVFENYNIITKSIMRVTRNADINMEEALYDHDVDLRDVMEALLKKRKKLSPVRLELTSKMNSDAVGFLCDKLELRQNQVFVSSTPLELSFVFQLRSRLEEKHPELFYKPAKPQDSPDFQKNTKLIPQILKKDLMLSYPYESIKPFISLLNEAADDPEVVSVKITLYRVASNSKIVEALINAAENGKEVFVLVELRARFDEENNIEWSKRLEEAGCTVIYGPQSLKVHSKLLLITRKTKSGLQYITQIGTGNYNEKTSALYTDLSIMTSDMRIGSEAGTVFNALSIGTLVENTQHLLVAPLCLQNKIIELIDYEIAAAGRGEDAYIGLKLNSLTDKALMDKLIEASNAGVKIDMVIRGICCLVAGVKGYTENITVRSVVGRYLEHSRIYIFGRGEGMKLYISSADFMTRNTLRRVEVAAPVYSAALKKRIFGIFEIMLSDNVKSRMQLPDSTYEYRRNIDQDAAEAEPLSCQDHFIEEAYSRVNKKPVKVRVRKYKN
ncbi:MAG: polyphosphate kinase 1 [Oscillospiraceae bacterium]|nr:polyphosphate kinase 1 [Oscillospiraceae bacterium]